MYNVKLTYFKKTGEYYNETQYNTHRCFLSDIWDEVKQFKNAGDLPGLIKYKYDFIILVDVTNHQHNRLKLII